MSFEDSIFDREEKTVVDKTWNCLRKRIDSCSNNSEIQEWVSAYFRRIAIASICKQIDLYEETQLKEYEEVSALSSLRFLIVGTLIQFESLEYAYDAYSKSKSDNSSFDNGDFDYIVTCCVDMEQSEILLRNLAELAERDLERKPNMLSLYTRNLDETPSRVQGAA